MRLLAACALAALLAGPVAASAVQPALQRAVLVLDAHGLRWLGAPAPDAETASCEIVGPVFNGCTSPPIRIEDSLTVSVDFLPGSIVNGIGFWEHTPAGGNGIPLVLCPGLSFWGLEDLPLPPPACSVASPPELYTDAAIAIHADPVVVGYWKVTMVG
jgi:hypothetical protein